MRSVRPVPFIVVVLLLSLADAALAGVRVQGGRKTAPPSDPVVPAQSAALFVGVQEFPRDPSLLPVKYAADDAVDLAFAMSIDARPRLVEPSRVVLALSGSPRKPQSQQKLETLKAAGAQLQPAGQTDILTLLERQSAEVGESGLLIVAFATHGITEKGTQYLLMADSVLTHLETAVSETKVRDIVSTARVPRSLILLDACRRQLTTDTRAGDDDPRSVAALLRSLGEVSGQVVFSAATPGEYAYDDEKRRNGVFTAAVVDGLHCGAATDAEGFVTVDTLSSYVEERMVSWLQKNRNPEARRATQLLCEGRSKRMPLAACVNDTAGSSSPPPE